MNYSNVLRETDVKPIMNAVLAIICTFDRHLIRDACDTIRRGVTYRARTVTRDKNFSFRSNSTLLPCTFNV